jgi:hypothetical protein
MRWRLEWLNLIDPVASNVGVNVFIGGVLSLHVVLKVSMALINHVLQHICQFAQIALRQDS